MPKEGPCPRCGEKELTTTLTPHRGASKQNKKGDKRRDDCGYCGWWSEGTFIKQEWEWITAPKLKDHERIALEKRLKKLKKERQKERYGNR